MKRDANCTLCPLHKTAEYVCLLGKGPEPCNAMMIGEAPGHREDDTGKPFVGRAGQLLDEMLANAGLDRSKLFITNAVACRPPANRTPRAREITACRKWVDYQVAMVKPKYIALLGNIALQSVLHTKGIKKMRGRAIEKNGIIYLPMYHPSYVLRGDLKDQPIAEQDLKRFKEIIDFGGIPEERALKFTVIDTWRKVDAMLEAMIGTISFDIETTALYPWAGNVVSLGFGTSKGEFVIPVRHKDSTWSQKDIKQIVETVSGPLKNCTVVAHNGKFDQLWMRVHYGVEWKINFDTMLAHYLIDENSRHDLEHLAQLYFAAPVWDIPLEEKQGATPIERLAKYHAHDLYYTRKLYAKLASKLEEDHQIKRVFQKLLMPCANLFVEMEYRGAYIDTRKMDEVERYLRKEMNIALARLAKWGQINWGSPMQVANLLYGKLKIKCPLRTKKGGQSSSESALKMIEHPCVSDLLKYRGHKQQLSFFIEGWKPYIHEHRIHPSSKLHGTVTGRLSYEHPNFQQVPRDALIRSLVTAPPGWTLVEADLSQIELRIVAELSRIPSMMEAFRNGEDIHWRTVLGELERYVGQPELVVKTAHEARPDYKPPRYAEAIEILRDIGPDKAIEINPRWKEMRKKAKAVGFGYVYGMGWKKFRIYARDNYDMHLTEEEAQASRINYFNMYPLEGWHTQQQRYAHTHGYTRSLAGRKRRLPLAMGDDDTYERAEALRQAINSPVQSFASDINLMVLLQLRDEFPRAVLQPIVTVHDSLIMEVRNDYVEKVVKRVEEIMRQPSLFEDFEIDLTVPIEGETKIGPWGSGKSLEKWHEQVSR